MSAPSHAALNQAAEWFAILNSGEATPADQGAWQRWLADRPEHREAWRYVERISQRFEPIKNSPARGDAITAFGQAQKRGRRQVVRGLGLLAGTALLGWGAWRHTPLPDLAYAWRADFHTGTARQQALALPDGTRVWMNAQTAFDQDYQAQERRLRLLRGEILIETASDARPFFVQTPQGLLQALGTRFTVRLEEGSSMLAVYDGAVAVQPADGGQARTFAAGQQIRFQRGGFGEAAVADPAREAWSRGLLLARHIPLAEVVAEMRPYFRGHLGLAPDVADLPVFGGFPLDDLDRSLNMLQAVLPIRVQRSWSWWISIDAR